MRGVTRPAPPGNTLPTRSTTCPYSTLIETNVQAPSLQKKDAD